MGASELRVGNIVDISADALVNKSDIYPVEVLEIMADRILWANHCFENIYQCWMIETTDFEKLKGIPLTEEWLVKFGFSKTNEISWSLGHKREYNVFRLAELTYNGIQAAWWFNGKLLTKQPEYVHQLQNLNFALTGEELTAQSEPLQQKPPGQEL